DQSAKHAGLIGAEPNNGAPLWSGTGPLPAGETANCLLCHSNGALQRVATHGQNPSLPEGFLIGRGGHFQSCEQCHTSRTTDPARRNPQIDFAAQPRRCTDCPTRSSTPADIATISCIGCHDNSASSVNPGGIDSRHTTPAAGANLVGFGYTFDSSTPAASVATNGRCLKCHAGTIATPS